MEVSFAGPTTLRSLVLPPVENLAIRRNFDPGATILVQAGGENGLVDIARREIPRSNWQDNMPLVLALPDANLTFASQGIPELWNPLTGIGTTADFYQTVGNRTTVHLDLPAAGSVFVIFRKGETKSKFTKLERDGETLVDLLDPQRIDTHPPQATQGLTPGEPMQAHVVQPAGLRRLPTRSPA